MKLSTAAALAGLIASASAHATFQYIWTDPSTSTNTCVRTPPNNNPVGTLDADLSCNANGAVPAAAKCAVAAGQEIGVEMHQQPGDRTCTTEAIGGNHDGPVIIYMAKVADSGAAFDPSTASWFKIVQEGLITADATTQTYYWATDDLNDNCGKFFFKIPSDIAPGDYMLRAEVIALHVAGSVGGAQHYMSCYQLTVTGGGSASPAGVKFPGAYSETDPGILFNIYTSFTTYTIPGPTVYGTGSRLPVPSGTVGGTTTTTKTSSTSTTTTTTKTATTTTTTSSTKTPTTTTTTTTTTKTTTTTANGATQTLYGQCGGTGYTGPTTCPSGAKCNTQNAYYSQCIPA